MAESTNDAPLDNNDTPKDSESEPKVDKPAQQERKFRSNTSYHSDLFKLKLAKTLKWLGYKKASETAPRNRDGSVNRPDWQEVEHVHFFRTVCSKGKSQTHSNPIGNHFHEMKIIRDPDDPGALPRVECASGALQWGTVEEYGVMVRKPVPVEFDEHTHKIEYIMSAELKRPDMNPDALKEINAQASRNSTKVYNDKGQPIGDLAVQ